MEDADVKYVILTLSVLGVVLAVSVWFAWSGWLSVDEVAETEVSAHGYIAMALGIFLSMIVGGGLMALLFYSARHGHDEIDQDF